MQADISKAIVDNLRLRLTQEEQGLIAGGTGDAAAYQFYLKGRHDWEQSTDESLKRAVGNFERAIARDPSYALAYDAFVQDRRGGCVQAVP